MFGMTVARAASRTARERARAELTHEIKTEARRQLVMLGAQRLSLRAVARELGMASSAIYRYFPSRDELLTELIIDAYDSLGASAEAADRACARADLRGRWRATCGAVRNWATAHPHEYALIYGSPVPGYQAPQATIAPAGRVALIIGGILADAVGQASVARPGSPPLPPMLAAQAVGVTDVIAPGVSPQVMTRALIAWTQLFGMISFELFGQLKGSVEPADEFFAYTIDLMAAFVGLPTD
jgi:AcrR family transcriptional regulator